MPTSFLSLPREIRDRIYSAILTIHGVISLSAIPQHNVGNNSSPTPRIKGQASAVIYKNRGVSLDTALCYVCHQVSVEALHTLYSTNTFMVPMPLSHFIHWLSILPVKHRRNIRNLEFVQRLLMPLLFDNSLAWKELYRFINGTHTRSGGEAMHLNRVFVHTPLAFNLYEPSQALSLSKVMSNSHTFWWPGLQFFASLLEDGSDGVSVPNRKQPSLYMLILRLPTFDKYGIPQSHLPVMKLLNEDSSVDVEATEVVQTLRRPRLLEDTEDEDQVLTLMQHHGLRSRETKRAWRDYFARPDVRDRPSLEFRASWVEKHEGRVLVLSNAALRMTADSKVQGGFYGITQSTSDQCDESEGPQEFFLRRRDVYSNANMRTFAE